ncbi:radical SAM family heme chaperone HemW [Ekhidna sp.]|uniref:radical SAM family heme chaperone HemW n=1 Tax=Ekhidna sp. TaxID=2608089 RepID=UPI00351618F1
MAGIYIHIPFCRQACHYCDFHFSTNLKTQGEMVKSIATEIRNRKDYLNEPVKTIYFGGGTPSLLNVQQLHHLLQTISDNFKVVDGAEVTLEANPEDLTLEKSKMLLASGINRLSIGMQTFDETKLQWMNRAHSSTEARKAYENVRKAGFKNISLDLIYAIPDHDQSAWETDIKSITELQPEHISMYGLTIEEKTVFGKWEEQDKLVQVPEDEAANQYLYAIDYLKDSGYIQYEVSNFGKEGFYSRHNNAYWAGVPYLGVGPGAHSFDGSSRRFNVRNNARYIKAINEGLSFSETEILSETQRLNEQILTQLRTAKGLDLETFEKSSGKSLAQLHAAFIDEMRQKELIEIEDNCLRLKPLGFLVADEIALRMFFPEE